MDYTIQKLADLSGVSARTLRYYDEIGLLRPARASGNGYRIYKQEQVDLLQQILFYRALGVSLEEIKSILSDPHFDRETALEHHLNTLLKQKEQIDVLIRNVKTTIGHLKGEGSMKDHEKFEGLKQQLIEENETQYGEEIRHRYGSESIDAANAKLQGMSPEQYQLAQDLSAQLNALLVQAMSDGDPACEAAQSACAIHKEWLCLFWPEGMYSKEAHLSLTSMYVEDERFTAYYDKATGTGATAFLQQAMQLFLA